MNRNGKLVVSLGRYAAADVHRAETSSRVQTTNYGLTPNPSSDTKVGPNRVVYVMGKGGVVVSGQRQATVAYNVEVDAIETQDNQNVAETNTGEVIQLDFGQQAPDFVDKFYRYVDAQGYTQVTAIVRPVPKEGYGNQWLPKPYRNAWDYGYPNIPYQPNRPAQYWADDENCISWDSADYPFYAERAICYFEGNIIDLSEHLPNQRILAAHSTDGINFELITVDTIATDDTEDFTYQYYLNYATGSPNSRCSDKTKQRKREQWETWNKPKHWVSLQVTQDLTTITTLDAVIPFQESVLYVSFIDAQTIFYISLTDTETKVFVATKTNTKSLYSLPAMLVDDDLRVNREFKEIEALPNMSSGSTSYIGGLQAFGTKVIDHQETVIQGQRVVACHYQNNQLGLTIETYYSKETTDINYPRTSYAVGLAIVSYPRIIQPTGVVAGYLYGVDINYGGKHNKAEYTYDYERSVSYDRVIIDFKSFDDLTVREGLGCSIPNGSVIIHETSGYLDEGRTRHTHIDDGDSYAIMLANDFTGVDLGAVTDYSQTSTVRTERIENITRIYACNPITDSYYLANTNIDTNVNYVQTEGKPYIGVFPENNPFVKAPVESITQSGSVQYIVGSKGIQHVHDEESIQPLRSLRVMKRYLGDPVDYKPFKEPYNFVRSGQRTVQGSVPDLTLSGVFSKNFSRNYSNAGKYWAEDSDKFVFTTNTTGIDLLNSGLDVQSYVEGVKQSDTLYRPVTVGKNE